MMAGEFTFAVDPVVSEDCEDIITQLLQPDPAKVWQCLHMGWQNIGITLSRSKRRSQLGCCAMRCTVLQRASVEDIKRHPWFLTDLPPGTSEYNDQALAARRELPQSKEDALRIIAEVNARVAHCSGMDTSGERSAGSDRLDHCRADGMCRLKGRLRCCRVGVTRAAAWTPCRTSWWRKSSASVLVHSVAPSAGRESGMPSIFYFALQQSVKWKCAAGRAAAAGGGASGSNPMSSPSVD